MTNIVTKSAFGILAAATAASSNALAQSNAAPGGAQDIISSPRGTVPNFDVQTIGPILSELGLVYQASQTADGTTYLTANIAGELNVSFIPSACLSSGRSNCIGLVTIAQFEGTNFNPQTVSAFNQKYSFVSTGLVDNGQYAFISRYDIADYGVARGNIASSVTNFYVLARKFRDEIQTSTKTVSLDGYADDLSSSILNKHSLEALGVISTPETNLDHHLASFEAAPEIVKILVNDPSTPKNKIVNVTKK